MPRSKIIDVDEMLEKFDKAIQETGKELAKEIEWAFDLAVDQFYGGYYPRSYDRTESTLKASSANNGKPSYKKLGKYSCDAGITVSSSYMGEPYHKDHGWDPSAEFIFNRTWNEGIHGFTNAEVASKKTRNRFMGVQGGKMIWDPMSPYTSLMKSHNFLNGYHAVDTIGSRQRGSKDRLFAPPKSTPPVTFMNSRFSDIKASVSSKFDSNFSL